MSSSLFPPSAFDQIAEYLARIPEPRPRLDALAFSVRPEVAGLVGKGRLAITIANDWDRANRMSVIARYEERARGYFAGLAIEPAASIARCERRLNHVEFFKRVESLRYQCCEDVSGTDRDFHDRMIAEMDRAIAEVAKRIVMWLPDYADAAWL